MSEEKGVLNVLERSPEKFTNKEFGSLSKVSRYGSSKEDINLVNHGIYFNGRSRVILIFADEKQNSLYIAVYNVIRDEFIYFSWLDDLKKFKDDSEIMAIEKYKDDENHIFFYVLTNEYCYSLAVDTSSFSGKITKRDKNTYSIKNTTNVGMCAVSGMPFIAGGMMGAGYDGTFVCYMNDTLNAFYRYNYLYSKRYNPIVLLHRDKLYFIGGNQLSGKDSVFMEFVPVYTRPYKNMLAANYLYDRNQGRPQIVTPSGFNSEIQANVDNLNAHASYYREEIYFFTKKTFSLTGRRYYRFNTLSHSWTNFQISEDILKAVKVNRIKSIKTVNVNNTIYIFISGYNLNNIKNLQNRFDIETYKFKPYF